MALKLTPSGKDLLLRAMAGEANINFAAIQFGNGSNAGAGAVELSNPLLTAEITSYEVGDVFVTLTAVFSNSEISAGFRATELGVLADDPDNEGGTLLYAYEYTSEAKSDYIPASTDKVLETQQDVLVYIGDAENVTASISQSLIYAGKADFDAFVARRDNPHKVTAKQVGLGNVPNVATDDQTPTWTMASTLTALVSGEKLSVAFGKLAKAVSSLMAHLAATGKNVHKETPASIGAAAASHKHSTTDITSGTLGVGRGGTGVTGYAALREKLGLGKSTDILAVEYGGTGVTTYDSLLSELNLSNAVLHKSAAITMPSIGEWNAVTYGNGKFVAVRENGSAAYSEDGVTWTEVSIADGVYWSDVVYGGGKFVAVAGNSSNKAAYSTDGVTWQMSALPKKHTWEAVTYGGGKFIAVWNDGSNVNTGAYSSDGITWYESELPYGQWGAVAYGGGKFVAIACPLLTKSDRAAYSEDGISWTAATLPSSHNWRDITYGAGKFVAITGITVSSNGVIAYSEDGVSWNETVLSGKVDAWTAITYGNGVFVVINGGRNLYSHDGITWKYGDIKEIGSFEDWDDVAYGAGKFVAVSSNDGDSGKCYVAQSLNGINWTNTVSTLTTVGGQDITLEVLASMELLKKQEE